MTHDIDTFLHITMCNVITNSLYFLVFVAPVLLLTETS